MSFEPTTSRRVGSNATPTSARAGRDQLGRGLAGRLEPVHAARAGERLDDVAAPGGVERETLRPAEPGVQDVDTRRQRSMR